MPIEGYINKRPDPDWWLDQIKAGEEFRKTAAMEGNWARWREYYRGEWRGDIMPVNLFFTMMRTIVPRIYFRNPSISVSPASPGLDNMTFARMLERIDNKMMLQMRMKKQLKKMVQNTFMYGTSFGKLGFGGMFTPSPIAEQVGTGFTTGVGKQNQRVEYYEFTEGKMPWFLNAHPKDVILPHGLNEFEFGRWVAQKIERPLEDVRADKRFENANKITSTREIDINLAIGNVHRAVKTTELYEIRDSKTGAVFVITPHTNSSKSADKVLYFGPDQLQQYGGKPWYQMVFNEDDEWAWGIPDSNILEPYQLELNDIKTQIMRHRRVTLVKILVKKGGMDADEAERLVSEDVGAVAWVTGNPNDVVKLIQGSTIPSELFIAADAVVQDTRETVGFSRNQFGEFNSRSGDTTATEAQIVSAASEIRVDERRDMMADMITDIVQDMHGLLFDNWGQEQIVDVVGPGGVPIWIQFRPELLRTGRYRVKVDPDSSLPQTKELREVKAARLYELLKTNPFIDPFKLTQYLLHELHGVQFDDMMRMLPPVGPEQAGGVLQPQQLSGLIQQSIGQVANGNAQLTPPAQGAG